MDLNKGPQSPMVNLLLMVKIPPKDDLAQEREFDQGGEVTGAPFSWILNIWRRGQES